MNIITWRGVVWVWSLAACAALASAQITFSRDWSGGKRAAPQLAFDCTQFSKVCKHFIHELKQAMSSEISGKTRNRIRNPEDPVPDYDEEN